MTLLPELEQIQSDRLPSTDLNAYVLQCKGLGSFGDGGSRLVEVKGTEKTLKSKDV